MKRLGLQVNFEINVTIRLDGWFSGKIIYPSIRILIEYTNIAGGVGWYNNVL
jgi:hypothetical protein